MRILVIEDFAPLREAIVQGLVEAGFAVDAVSNGQDGLWQARSGEHDVIILDLMLPKIDGLTILKTLRGGKPGGRTSASAGPNGPGKPCKAHILVLTAKDTAEDRIRGLDLGADDYLVKPFVFGELLARIRALVRRKYETHQTLLRIADLEVELSHRRVTRAGRMVELSNREYALLEYLALNAHRIVSRTEIWQHVYDFNASLESNVVDVFVGLVRKKIERPGLMKLLHTRRGQGYILTDAAEDAQAPPPQAPEEGRKAAGNGGGGER